jgi:hypothetical protein
MRGENFRRAFFVIGGHLGSRASRTMFSRMSATSKALEAGPSLRFGMTDFCLFLNS